MGRQSGVMGLEVEKTATVVLDLLDEQRCREWLLSKVHPFGPSCPGCGGPVVNDRQVASWWAGRRVCCKCCGKYFSATTGTVLNKMGLSFSPGVFTVVRSGSEFRNKDHSPAV